MRTRDALLTLLALALATSALASGVDIAWDTCRGEAGASTKCCRGRTPAAWWSRRT